MERTSRSISLTASLLALAVVTGCAGTQKTSQRIVWPFPPDPPRIQYVRTLSNTADVESGFRRFWTQISGKGSLGVFNPSSVALSPDERRLYVACVTVGVVVFDFEKGTVERAANSGGRKPKAPWSVAVDGNGNLYVGDQVERVVWVYSADGTFLRQIGNGMFVRPAGLAFDRKRQLLYVVDGSNGASRDHRVEVFAPDGRHLRTIGTRGEGPGELNFPSYAAVAPDGKLYVADTGNFRIAVFDPEGAFVTTMGAVGDGPGQFGKVKGMAFDAFGNLYVVDGQFGLVQMFNRDLRPLMFFGGPFEHPAFMKSPNGIAIDSKNNIYVSDYMFNHVNQYALVNTKGADAESPSASDASARGDSRPQPSTSSPSPPAADPRR